MLYQPVGRDPDFSFPCLYFRLGSVLLCSSFMDIYKTLSYNLKCTDDFSSVSFFLYSLFMSG